MTDSAVQRQSRSRADRRAGPMGIAVVRPLVVVGLLGATATIAVSATPALRFAYRSEAAHATIETAALIIAGLAAALVAGRAIRSASRNFLLLAAGLGVLSLTNLLFSLVPTLADDTGPLSIWGGMFGRLTGGALFAAAAVLPERRLAAPMRALRIATAAVVAGVAAAGLAVLLLADVLPPGVEVGLSPETADRPRIVGHPVVLGAQIALIALYATATVGFGARARRGGDRLLRGFAIAALISALARVNYFLFPSLYSEWVYTGDVLRLAHFLVILVVVIAEVLEYQRRASVAAVLDERRRVARELHDGLAQELAFIRGEARRIERSSDDGVVFEALVSAADRAMDESRTAIAALSRPADEPLIETLRHAAEAVALRSGVRVAASGDDELMLAPELCHGLSRIVREATANAVRHGGATAVELHVAGHPHVRVSIRDDGSGFDPDAAKRPDAFGLLGMSERAGALGGRLDVRSAPGACTTVEVRLL